MRFVTGAVSALVLLVLAACGGQTPPPAAPPPPAIKRFTADKPKITAGESVTLSFEADHASSVELLDQDGAKVHLTGDAAAGSATVTPATSTFYVLRVSGEGGRDSTFVHVAVDHDLEELFLVAVPPQVEAGRPVQLLWSAPGARTARIQSSAGDAIDLNAASGSGVLELTPVRTTAYTLIGAGGASGELTASVEVKVRPMLASFQANPTAAKVGETIQFSWKTAGAHQVSLTEMTWGEIYKASFPAEADAVDQGGFTWTVPQMLPGARGPVGDGLPLRFTLTVTQENPSVTITRTIDSFVGEGPRVLDFRVPEAASEGRQVKLSWLTLNAERLQVFENGALVYEPLARDLATVAQGTLTLAAPTTDTTYKLIAWGHEGTQAVQTGQVRIVKLPSVDSFTVPGAVSQPGAAAAAQWTTSNATTVTIRARGGAVVHSATGAKAAADGTSLYPGQRTTYVLEAWNDAGDVARKEATVEVGGNPAVTASPSPALTGETITVAWDLDSGAAVEVIGDPNSPVLKSNPSQLFFDLANHGGARTLVPENPADAVTPIPLAVPFRFPFLGRTVETFYVSTNGFVGFDPSSSLPGNSDASSSRLPAMLAPFWDDLSLGAEGKILYLVEGNAFPRRLIVQWNKVQTDDESELTFQVQMLETGEFRFAYKTLTGTDSAGESATIGWRLNDSLSAAWSRDQPNLVANDELVFFTNGSWNAQLEFAPDVSGQFNLFARRQTGTYVSYPARVTVLAPDSVKINELMVAPDVSATAGQWIELANTTSLPIDLSGTQLVSTSTATSWTIPEGIELPARGFLVLGQDTNPLANGGAPVQFAWTGLTLDANGDEISLMATGPVSTFAFGPAEVVPGTSLVAASPAIDGGGAPIVCPRTLTFGDNGAFGSPGARNESCYRYTLSRIPEAFEDISQVGLPLFGGSAYEDYVGLNISAVPFPYFGAVQTELYVDVNGYMSFADPGESEWVNPTTPASGDPFGTISPFYDDLTSENSDLYAARLPAAGALPARTIIQWDHVETWFDGGDLTFQVKLFDDGAIEFHYADMISGGSLNDADGNRATIWIAAPDFSSALPIGINQPVIQPHTAWRFTPNP